MNAGDAVPLFAGMLTQKPWEEVTQRGSAERLKLKYTEAEREAIQVGWGRPAGSALPACPAAAAVHERGRCCGSGAACLL